MEIRKITWNNDTMNIDTFTNELLNEKFNGKVIISYPNCNKAKCIKTYKNGIKINDIKYSNYDKNKISEESFYYDNGDVKEVYYYNNRNKIQQQTLVKFLNNNKYTLYNLYSNEKLKEQNYHCNGCIVKKPEQYIIDLFK